MAKYDEPRHPKPFEFISIPPLREEDRTHPAGHDRYVADSLSGQMTLTLGVITPLHIGTGGLRLTGNSHTPLVRATVRVNDRPAIPGSTMKGMVRSVVEAITRSCVRSTKAKRDALPRGATGCRDPQKLCISCRMFGSLGYLGNVRFGDAVLGDEFKVQIVGMPTLHSPQADTDVYYDGDRVRGRKFYKHGQTVTTSSVPVEICPPKSRLLVPIHFDNLSKAELGLLLIALGLGEKRFYLKVGGGKPACYGSLIVGLTDFRAWVDPKDVYGNYDLQQIGIEAAECIVAAKQLVLRDYLVRLTQLLQFDFDRQCPDGEY